MEASQTRAIAEALLKLRRALAGAAPGGAAYRGAPLARLLDALEAEMDAEGVDALAGGRGKPGNLARPRRFELAAALNRLRTAQIRQLA